MKLTTKGLKNELTVRSLNKKQYKQLDFKHTGFENKKLQTIVKDDILYFSTTDMINPSDWRELGITVGKAIQATKVKSACTILSKVEDEFLEGILLSDYSFDKYKSEVKEVKEVKLQVIVKKDIDVKSKLKEISARVKAQNLTKDWVNTTPEDAHSGSIGKFIHKRFENTQIKVTEYNEKDLKKLGMRGHLAVNRASRHEAKTYKLEYNPFDKGVKKEHHIFVGKGLTYDSGGLDIKTGGHMRDMKSDKAGAMTLLGLMDYIARIGIDCKVTCYLALAENMIDGTAYKADDVLTMKNGKTVHIKNTDAEGRIVLFDNLSLAEEEYPKATTYHSLATLTGAAVYQFDGACGLVGFNEKLKRKVQKNGRKTGEIYMNAEFHTDMMNGVDDKLADLSNTGTPNMGCQKAGLFLTNAMTKKGKKRYVHHDIAGPAFKDGFATGFGVRTLISFLKVV